MLISFLIANPLAAAGIWAVMYIFDYGATLWFAQRYRQDSNRHITFEGGVELNPVFEKAIARGLVSPRFLVLLTLVTALLVLIGLLDPFGIGFEFVIGAPILMWFFIDLRHLRNLYSYSQLKARPEAMEGHIKQSYWLSQRMIAFDAFGFALVCALAWLVSGRLFFAGGMAVCTALALRHFRLSKRTPKI